MVCCLYVGICFGVAPHHMPVRVVTLAWHTRPQKVRSQIRELTCEAWHVYIRHVYIQCLFALPPCLISLTWTWSVFFVEDLAWIPGMTRISPLSSNTAHRKSAFAGSPYSSLARLLASSESYSCSTKRANVLGVGLGSNGVQTPFKLFKFDV